MKWLGVVCGEVSVRLRDQHGCAAWNTGRFVLITHQYYYKYYHHFYYYYYYYIVDYYYHYYYYGY